MSADIEKLAVFDDRIIQTRPRYAVEKGALSLTNSPFNAISQTQSQHTYNIYVPSENVYVSRELEWSSTVYLALSVNCSDTQGGDYPINEPLFTFGVDGSLAAFPLNSLCATMTATINDTTTTINSQDVLTEVLRLCDYRGNRLQRTCPTMLDKYQENSAALGAQNDPCSGYTNMAHDYGEVPNGAYYNVAFTNPAGAVLPKSVNSLAYTTPSGVKVATNQFGVPITRLQDNGLASASYTVYLKVRTTEKLVLSPFTFAEEHGCDTGLFGINNIQLVMNMRDPTRCMRLRNSVSGSAQKVYYSGSDSTNWGSPLAYNTVITGGAFTDSVVNVTFLTPSLDIPLPPKSVVPYTEFPRYITQPQNSEIAAGAVGQLQSQTITLPQIPDLFVIYVKPVASQTALNIDRAFDPTLPQFGSGYLPVQTSRNGARTVSPLSVNFDNFSGLLSSQTAEQLYAMSVRNGLDMDWNTWAGVGRAANTAGPQEISTVGGFLVLKP